MKKVMFAAAVAAGMVAFGEAIQSANIVGYQDVSKGAVKQPLFGFTFTPVSGATTVKLGAVTAKGMEGGNDIIQVINPTTLGTSARYTYYSDTQARAALRREFLLTAIAKEEKVEVTFNDLLPVISEIAQREKKNIKQVVKALQDNHQMEVIGSSIMFTKTLDKIISLADVTVVKDEK